MALAELNTRLEKCENNIEEAFADISMMYDVLFNALYETLIDELKNPTSEYID